MAVMTDGDYRDAITVELGDSSGLVLGNVELYWNMFVRFAARPYLRALLTERRCIRLLLGNNREQAAVPAGGDGDNESSLEAESNRSRELRSLLEDVNAEIKMMSAAGGRAGSRYASGLMNATSPYPAAVGQRDPSDLRYYPDARERALRTVR